MKKRCPRHDDSTPSVTLYPNGAWCHAGCGFIPLSELGVDQGELSSGLRVVECVDQSIQAIQSMPRRDYRGFSLPTDGRGSYLLWPSGDYYKLRLYSGKPKYRGPAGHSPPPFWVRQGTSSTLLVVEGEFEAMSAALAVPEFDVVSPGSATNFNKSLLTHLKPYANIILVADEDKAGIEAVMNLGALIYTNLPGVPFQKVFKSSEGKDFNDILVEFGTQELRSEITRLLQKVRGSRPCGGQ